MNIFVFHKVLKCTILFYFKLMWPQKFFIICILILTFTLIKKQVKIECDTKLEEPILDIYYDNKQICYRMSSSLILILSPPTTVPVAEERRYKA